MTTRAFRTLDCAHKLRVRFYLPRAIDLPFVESLPGSVEGVEEFSRIVAGARDLVRFVDDGCFSGSAVLGGNLLVVTFGKFADDADPEAFDSFVDTLEAHGCGPVEEVRADRPVPRAPR
ncbi:MAG: hypothetical protein KDB80_11835 [Planctomycetes bacterium]|nr:hypothetical protein [Planctomycetota bacterium]